MKIILTRLVPTFLAPLLAALLAGWVIAVPAGGAVVLAYLNVSFAWWHWLWPVAIALAAVVAVLAFAAMTRTPRPTWSLWVFAAVAVAVMGGLTVAPVAHSALVAGAVVVVQMCAAAVLLAAAAAAVEDRWGGVAIASGLLAAFLVNGIVVEFGASSSEQVLGWQRFSIAERLAMNWRQIFADPPVWLLVATAVAVVAAAALSPLLHRDTPLQPIGGGVRGIAAIALIAAANLCATRLYLGALEEYAALGWVWIMIGLGAVVGAVVVGAVILGRRDGAFLLAATAVVCAAMPLRIDLRAQYTDAVSVLVLVVLIAGVAVGMLVGARHHRMWMVGAGLLVALLLGRPWSGSVDTEALTQWAVLGLGAGVLLGALRPRTRLGAMVGAVVPVVSIGLLSMAEAAVGPQQVGGDGGTLTLLALGCVAVCVVAVALMKRPAPSLEAATQPRQ